MASELKLGLYDVGNTVHERAGIGGLATTMLALKEANDPLMKTMDFTIQPESLHIRWQGDDDVGFLKRLHQRSFQIDKGVIHLPGAYAMDKPTAVVIHNGLMSTFFQHAQVGKPMKVVSDLGESETAILKLPIQMTDGDDLLKGIIAYKGVASYPHQHGGKLTTGKSIPAFVNVTAAMLPGVVDGNAPAIVSWQQAMALEYQIVTCPVFLMKAVSQPFCHVVVVPDVCDLKQFTEGVQRLSRHHYGKAKVLGLPQDLCNITSSAADAALRFMTAVNGRHSQAGIRGCTAFVIRKFAMDKKQVYRGMSMTIGAAIQGIEMYDASVIQPTVRLITKSRTSPKTPRSKKDASEGEPIVIPILRSFLPGLVAVNLASKRHWAHGIDAMLPTKESFEKFFRYEKARCKDMLKAITDPDEWAFIKIVQEAWIARRSKIKHDRQLRGEDLQKGLWEEYEKEALKLFYRVRRLNTQRYIVEWLMTFVTVNNANYNMRQSRETAYRVIFGRRDIVTLRSLILFALNSIETKKDDKKGTDDAPPTPLIDELE